MCKYMSELKLTLFLYNHTLLHLGLVLKLECSRKNVNTGRSKGQSLSQANPKSPSATLTCAESSKGPEIEGTGFFSSPFLSITLCPTELCLEETSQQRRRCLLQLPKVTRVFRTTGESELGIM